MFSDQASRLHCSYRLLGFMHYITMLFDCVCFLRHRYRVKVCHGHIAKHISMSPCICFIYTSYIYIFISNLSSLITITTKSEFNLVWILMLSQYYLVLIMILSHTFFSDLHLNWNRGSSAEWIPMALVNVKRERAPRGEISWIITNEII